MDSIRNIKRLAILLAVPTCLFAADPIFLRRQVSDVKLQPGDLTAAKAKAASYKPLFGIGDQNADQLKSVARYGELTVGPGGTSAMVSYPAEEQIYFVEEGNGTLLYGDEKAPVKKNDFMYLPIGVRHGIANSSNAPVKAIVMGYKIPAGMKVQPTPKLMLASADDVQLQPGGTNIPHNHPSEEEIYLLLRGSGDMVAGLDADGKEARHAVTEGAAFLFKPGMQVGYYSNAKEGQPHDLMLAVRSRVAGMSMGPGGRQQ